MIVEGEKTTFSVDEGLHVRILYLSVCLFAFVSTVNYEVIPRFAHCRRSQLYVDRSFDEDLEPEAESMPRPPQSTYICTKYILRISLTVDLPLHKSEQVVHLALFVPCLVGFSPVLG